MRLRLRLKRVLGLKRVFVTNLAAQAGDTPNGTVSCLQLTLEVGYADIT